MAKKKPEVNFAEGFAELERIAHWFEESQADLDQGLEKFQRAMELTRLLKQRLLVAKNQIQDIRLKATANDDQESFLQS